MSRPLVGVSAAVHSARFGPWDQDVAMVPATMIQAVQELGWLPLVITADSTLAGEPDELLRLLDGLIVPAWGPRADRYADFSRTHADALERRGLPVVRIDQSLLVPESTVADYSRAIGGLFIRDVRVSSA